MKLLIPIDVWQDETNAHLGQDLKRMLPISQAHIVLLYAMQSEPHVEKAIATAIEEGRYLTAGATVGQGIGATPVLAQYVKGALDRSKNNPDYFYTEIEKAARKRLDDLAGDLKPLCLSVETLFEHGTPAKIIESVATAKEADLTVIRGSAAGLLESAFLGNTVSQVIKHSQNAVLVLRAGAIETALQKVIIALDGSDQAKTALRQFCNLYQSIKQNIEIVLSHVVSIPGPWRFISPIEFVATLEDNLDMAGKAILAEGESILLDCGWKPKKMPVPMIVRTGDPAVELDRLAGELDAGLIVLGAQGKTAMQSFLLGSVSEALALKSGFPILVFK